MATYQKFNATVADFANGEHDLATDQLTVALTNSAPVAANSVLSDLTQIAYTNLSSRNITTTSSTQAGGVYSCVLAPLTLSASGGAVAEFQYVVAYNSSNDKLIHWADVGSAVNLADTQDFDITWGSPAFTIS